MTVCSYRPQIDKNREILYNNSAEPAVTVITIHDAVHAPVERSPTTGPRRSPARQGVQGTTGEVLPEMILSYGHSAFVQAVLKDARFAFKLSDDNYECNGHGMAYSGDKSLYRGTAGEFILHTRAYRGYGTPQERILSLPVSARLADYLSYEANHQAEYSPWQDMIADDV